MSRVISFNSLKGGVGKTTCAILFARKLRERKKSVLMIDLDPQYSLTSYYCDGDAEPNRTLFRYLANRRSRLTECLTPTDEIWLLASSVDLVDYNVAHRLKRDRYALLKRLERDGAFTLFDYIIIDTPPTFSFLNALTISFVDTIFVVAVPEIWAVRAVSLYLTALRQFTSEMQTRFEDIHLIVNRYERRQRIDVETLEAVQERYSEYYVGPPIPFSNSLRNFILFKNNYRSFFNRVDEPVSAIIDQTVGRAR
jgi:cellulose biosynthesis protein BcsQ